VRFARNAARGVTALLVWAALNAAGAFFLGGCSGEAGQRQATSPAAPQTPRQQLGDSLDSALTDGGANPAPDEESDEDALDGATDRRGWLGVELSATAAREPGVLVRSVVRGSPAARAGVAAGDVILTIDGETVAQPSDVVRLVGERSVGQRTSIGLVRGTENRLLAVTLAKVPADNDVMRMNFVGGVAPSFMGLQTVQGSVAASIGALRGKVVLLEFWAPWCVACRFLVPTMNDWHAQFRPQGVEVIGITMDPVLQASQAARQLGMEYNIASDFSGETSRAYRAHSIPTLFVIDRKGIVRDVMVGYSAERLEALRSLLGRLVSEP
jgi:peroxiredoxin